MGLLKLVEDHPDQDVVDALDALLVKAKSGQLTGLAFIALHRGTGYSADVLGSTHQHPLFTLGVCRALEEAVAIQTRKKT